jgi:hypothetical protein
MTFGCMRQALPVYFLFDQRSDLRAKLGIKRSPRAEQKQLMLRAVFKASGIRAGFNERASLHGNQPYSKVSETSDERNKKVRQQKGRASRNPAFFSYRRQRFEADLSTKSGQWVAKQNPCAANIAIIA